MTMTNAGDCTLILPGTPPVEVLPGGTAEVSKDASEIPSVAEWIKAGKLVPVKARAKS